MHLLSGSPFVATGIITNAALLDLFQANLDAVVDAHGEADLGPATAAARVRCSRRPVRPDLAERHHLTHQAARIGQALHGEPGRRGGGSSGSSRDRRGRAQPRPGQVRVQLAAPQHPEQHRQHRHRVPDPRGAVVQPGRLGEHLTQPRP